jgi:hypothetical protein
MDAQALRLTEPPPVLEVCTAPTGGTIHRRGGPGCDPRHREWGVGEWNKGEAQNERAS